MASSVYEPFRWVEQADTAHSILADSVCRSSEDEVMITRLLEKSIRRTEAVDREALCIVAGEKVGRIATTRADSDSHSLAGMATTINAAFPGRRGEPVGLRGSGCNDCVAAL
jgi:hypothetical protein